MAIKINGQDLKKRFINGQEIVRVYKAGVQVRPDTVFDDFFWMSNGGVRHGILYLRHSWGTTPSPSEYPTLEYSLDKVTRTDYTITSGTYVQGPTINLEIGDKVYRRNKSTTPSTFSRGRLDYWTFQGDVSFYTGGDLTSLICKYGTNALPNHCFRELFSGLPLLSIPKLTATTLGDNCYFGTFYNTNAQLDTTEHGEYQYPFRLPYTGTIPGTSPIFNGMFQTSGANNYVVSPDINTTYYCNFPTY